MWSLRGASRSSILLTGSRRLTTPPRWPVARSASPTSYSYSHSSRSQWHRVQQLAAPSMDTMMWAGALASVACVVLAVNDNNFSANHHSNHVTYCDARRTAHVPVTGDIIQTGTPVKEPATGILFPRLCNSYYITGTGVRIKYGFIKVYAVGTYLDPLAMSAVKMSGPAAIQAALLNPVYPRTIRIVMARDLSVDKFTDALKEALEPRMQGVDLDKLDEFKQLNPPVDLIKGSEVELTIRGDTLLYKNAVGGVGTIKSEAFTKALCDVYYGVDAVSPTHRDAVLAGVPTL